MVPKLYPKFLWNIAKKWFHDKRYNFKANEDFQFKFVYHNLKSVGILWNIFKSVSLELAEKWPAKLRYERAGWGRYVTKIDYMVDKIIF